MTRYVATINVPGYLPMDDDPPTFDTPDDAWSYLAEERERGEDSADVAPSDTPDHLRAMRSIGTVYADTPGSDSDHDLGLAYSVDIAEEEGEDS